MTLQLPFEGLSDSRLRERTRMVFALAELREQWQQTAGRESLLKIQTPVGLLFADIVDKLELTSQERHVILGGKLTDEVDSFLETSVSRKLSH